MAGLPAGLYIHYPWCVRKCPYCDFNSRKKPAASDCDRVYFAALKQDFEKSLPLYGSVKFKSVYLGGGTPTLCDADLIADLLSFLRPHLEDRCEISMEANPGTVSLPRFKALKDAGVNRLSLGVQSFDDGMLKFLRRIHDGRTARLAVEDALAAGFTDLNIDLMHGLEGQDAEGALNDLKIAADLGCSHLSWYELTVEEDTEFYKRDLNLPSEDTLADIESAGFRFLKERGFERYEISGFTRGKRCLHNENYWRFGDYLGLGAGAHSKLFSDRQTLRRANPEAPADYLEAVRKGGIGFTPVAAAGIPFEYMLNRLRLFESIEISDFERMTALPFDKVKATLLWGRDQGLIEFAENESYAVTALGRRMLNELLERFLPA